MNINPDLSYSKANNFEIGWRFTSVQNLLEATLFHINTKNEIIPYEIEAFPGRDFYRNAGETSRLGIELFWEHQKGSWTRNLVYTFSDFRFTDYKLTDYNLSGNNLPGIPTHNISSSLKYSSKFGWETIFQSQFAGSLYADDINQTKVSSYLISNLRFSKSLKKLRFFAGINNLFNVDYFDNIRINAFGKRFYEPAAKRNYYFGINIDI